MTLPLPDPLVAVRDGTRPLGEDVDHRLSPWGVQRNFEAIAQRFPLGPGDLHFGGTVTSLPTGVDEGFEVNYVASSSAGVVWRLKYLPTLSVTYPWLFIGGPPLYAEVTATQTTTSTTYVALATAGPSVTLPRAGDYDIAIGARISQNAETRAALMSYDIGATGASDADAIDYFGGDSYDGANGTVTAPLTRERRKTGLTAVTLTSKYRAGGSGGTASFSGRWMRVTPIRLA